VQLRSVLQLMKMARQRDLLAYFEWFVKEMTYGLLNHGLAMKMLNYALTTNSDLDLEKIYLTVSSNPELQNDMLSIAEKLKAEGKAEGRLEGERRGDFIGSIRSFEKFLGMSISSREALGQLSATELEVRYGTLNGEYELRFKGK
jgi:hypothetical protein